VKANARTTGIPQSTRKLLDAIEEGLTTTAVPDALVVTAEEIVDVVVPDTEVDIEVDTEVDTDSETETTVTVEDWLEVMEMDDVALAKKTPVGVAAAVTAIRVRANS
jgi:hypothetical protein